MTIENLRKLAGEATPGPWFAYVEYPRAGIRDDWIIARHQPEYPERDMMAIVGSMLSDGSNPELVCAMRNALPAILAALDAAQAVADYGINDHRHAHYAMGDLHAALAALESQ